MINFEVRKRNFIKRINKAFDDLDFNVVGYFNILDAENGYLAERLDDMSDVERTKAIKVIDRNKEMIETLSKTKVISDAMSGKRLG